MSKAVLMIRHLREGVEDEWLNIRDALSGASVPGCPQRERSRMARAISRPVSRSMIRLRLS